MAKITRQETFFVQGVGSIDRGEALRALIASIYTVAKEKDVFTTDAVFATIRGYDHAAFRQAVASSKLVAVALRKAEAYGYCSRTPGTYPGGTVCHGRRKQLWLSWLKGATVPGSTTAETPWDQRV